MIKRISRSIGCLLLISAGSIHAQNALYPNAFPLGDVKLMDGPFKRAMDLNTAHMLKYSVDRLTASYYKEAGLVPKAADYSGYDGSWQGLNGHVGGHYLSALAMQYAATGDTLCKQRLDYMVAELKKCQDANGKDPDFAGYLSGIPNGKSLFRQIKQGDTDVVRKHWVPWYNIHKIYAGLRDTWVYAGNEEAKLMFLKLCDWGIHICSGLSDEQMQSMLDIEHGGMNEMYADAYWISGETPRYIDFARKFSHRDILDNMAKGADNLDGKHANTQVPKAIGFQRIAELVEDVTYYKAAKFFWTNVAMTRSIAIGGNSDNELFLPSSRWMEYINKRNGVETCNTHNMLKLTEGLFRMKPDAKYADYYEKALFNHIASSQHPAHGGYVYFTSAHPRHYRVYSAPDSHMWCCVGTGLENHTKYGQFIYTHHGDSLLVNLFIASELDWKDKGVTIKQDTRFPDEEKSILTVSAASPTRFKLLVRHPSWCRSGAMQVTVGKEAYGANSQPSSYIEIERTWKNGEQVSVALPMDFSFEPLNNVPSWVALKRGPIVLGAKINVMPVLKYIAGLGRFDHSAGGDLLDPDSAPKLKIDRSNFHTQFQSVSGKTFTYKAPGIFQNSASANLELLPFSRIHDSRYMMYWNASVSGTEVVTENQLPATSEVVRVGHANGFLTFSFTTTDPSRRINILMLSGREVADIPASARNTTFDYLKKGIRMGSGIYAIQVRSGGRPVCVKLCVSGM